MATFGERLRELRKRDRIKQKEIAEILGVGVVTVNRWESGAQQPAEENAYDIYSTLSDLFNVPILYITGESDECKPYNYGSDEDAAREAIAAEINNQYQVLRMFLSLSPEMKAVVSATLVKAYRIDKERGALLDLLDDSEDDNSDGESETNADANIEK